MICLGVDAVLDSPCAYYSPASGCGSYAVVACSFAGFCRTFGREFRKLCLVIRDTLILLKYKGGAPERGRGELPGADVVLRSDGHRPGGDNKGMPPVSG
eukprot:2570301-Pyramimonas_sp.AAC.3